MKLTSPRLQDWLPAVAGVIVILFSIVGFARVVGWVPDSTKGSGEMLTSERPALPASSPARAGPRCPECGMVVSVRKIESDEGATGFALTGDRAAGGGDAPGVKASARYEIVVRMTDSSIRVINQVKPANWKPGERMIVIGGADPPDR